MNEIPSPQDTLKAMQKNIEDKRRQDLLDQFAMHSPIQAIDVVQIHGRSDLRTDSARVAFLSTWAFMNYEYAEAMLRQRETIMAKVKADEAA
jgi:hypothetical protein